MFKIRKLNQISVKGLERFARERYEIAGEIGHPDAIIVRSQQLTLADIVPSLKAIARAGAGVNNIPVAECTQRGIPVFNTPGANANAVKELVLAGMLLASRGVLEGIQYAQGLGHIKDYQEMNKLIEKDKKNFVGQEIAGKTLGVVGLGAIGSLVADMGLSLGMKVLGYDPALSVDAAWRLSNEVRKMENLPSLLAKSHYVSLHLPVLEETKNLLNHDMLKVLQPGTRLFNFSREAIVNTEAVLWALESAKLHAYVTDFPTPELIGKKGVILMPHIGASTEEAEENCAIMAADQLVDYLENGNVKNSVNFPTLSLDRTGGHRIAFSNKNVPKMLSKVLAILADRNINVMEILNKSRDEIAYNLIDIDLPPTPELLSVLKGIEGVISVRSL